MKVVIIYFQFKIAWVERFKIYLGNEWWYTDNWHINLPLLNTHLGKLATKCQWNKNEILFLAHILFAVFFTWFHCHDFKIIKNTTKVIEKMIYWAINGVFSTSIHEAILLICFCLLSILHYFFYLYQCSLLVFFFSVFSLIN